jgi:hypothetical protein
VPRVMFVCVGMYMVPFYIIMGPLLHVYGSLASCVWFPCLFVCGSPCCSVFMVPFDLVFAYVCGSPCFALCTWVPCFTLVPLLCIVYVGPLDLRCVHWFPLLCVVYLAFANVNSAACLCHSGQASLCVCVLIKMI